jgi:3-dehydroquinate synthase
VVSQPAAIKLPHPVLLAPGAFDQIGLVARTVAPGHRVVAISDLTVAKLYGRPITNALRGTANETASGEFVAFELDEKRKTRETWANITDRLIDTGYGRDTVLVAVGGGVVGDIVGFVAATYMRGIPCVQVPTTLLAMVDASIGGKTGVDTPRGKNLVGAFHPPAAVIIDPTVLGTLPQQHLRAGFAEILKHGIIADATYFDVAATFIGASGLAGGAVPPEMTDIIRRSVEIKAEIVARDEREGGLRKILNFGHTIGHAIEAASEYHMLHGECVALGMIAEARLAEAIGIATNGTARTVESVCKAAGLPTSLPQMSADLVMEYMRADKKARAGRLEYALPKRIGEMAGADSGWAIPVEDSVVRAVLAA